MARPKLFHYLRYPPAGLPVPVAVGGNVLAEFLNVTLQEKLDAFESEFGMVCDGRNLALNLRNATAAAAQAREQLTGPELAQKILRIAEEVVNHNNLPARITTVEIRNGRAVVADVAENLTALLVDLALLHITASKRCAECGCPIPNKRKYCEIHGTRNARLERQRRDFAEQKIKLVSLKGE